MGVHSIFGPNAPGGTFHQDGPLGATPVWMGAPFRLTSGYASLSVPTASCIGGRFYLPPAGSISGGLPTYALVRVWEHPMKTKSIGYVNSITYSMSNLATFPSREVRVDGLVFGGWNEAFFDPPVRMPVTGRMLAIAVAFPGKPGFYYHYDNSHVTPDANHMAYDGYPLAWPPNDLDAPESYAHGWRAAGAGPPYDTYTIGGETGSLTAGYGIDILVKDDIDTGEQELYTNSTTPGDLKLANLLEGIAAGGAGVAVKMLGYWDGSAVQQLRATNPSLTGLTAPTTPVRFTVTGSTFTPYLTFRDHEGTVVAHWVCEENATFNKTDTVDPSTGAYTPTFTFGSAATRHVTLYVDDGAGHSRMNVVETLNLGYDDTVDTAERSSVGAVFNKSPESLTAIENLTSLTGLLHFMADNTRLSGALNCTGLKLMRFCSVYTTDITSIDLTGCASVKRLVVERCHLTTLDLNPVKDTLEDLRAANQFAPADMDEAHYHVPGLTFTMLTGPMSRLWHYCVRAQRLTNSLDGDNIAGALPVVVQCWDWSTPKGDGTARTGTYSQASTYLNSVVSHHNSWTALDLTGQTNLTDLIDMSNNALAAVTLTGAFLSGTIHLSNNSLPAAAVNAVLAKLAAQGNGGGVLHIGTDARSDADATKNHNAAPTGQGITDVATLRSRGWTVTTN